MTTDYDRLLQQANEQNAEWPQYKGHWDGWEVGVIRAEVRTKMGLAFARFDEVLYQPQPADPTLEFVTAYSWRNKCDTSIQKYKVEPKYKPATVTITSTTDDEGKAQFMVDWKDGTRERGQVFRMVPPKQGETWGGFKVTKVIPFGGQK